MAVRRALVVVLDSVGVGATEDAPPEDRGANTLSHVAQATGLRLPYLTGLGLAHIAGVEGLGPAPLRPSAAYGRMRPASPGKDTLSGHWELFGLILDEPIRTYPGGFPPEVIAAFELAIGREVLGNVAASGTEIIQRLGGDHLRTGKPIVYTSADSVFQIAAHEGVVPVATLYDWCRSARSLLMGDFTVGRVIARPFAGPAGSFYRTKNRRDFGLAPPGRTVLDSLVEAGLPVVGIGKIHDIFTGRGVTASCGAGSNAEGLAAIGDALSRTGGGLLLANLVDFDMLFGHRNDPAGYAEALREADRGLAALAASRQPGDLWLFTADHGCDPTHPGTDHTREYVPVLALGLGEGDLGTRNTFADVGATVADWLGVTWPGPGEPLVQGGS